MFLLYIQTDDHRINQKIKIFFQMLLSPFLDFDNEDEWAGLRSPNYQKSEPAHPAWGAESVKPHFQSIAAFIITELILFLLKILVVRLRASTVLSVSGLNS